MSKFGKILLILLTLTVTGLGAAEKLSEAEKIYSEGRKLYLAGEYHDAAKKFEDSFFMADTPAVRANSLLAQIGAYRMCKLYFREFQSIEKLLDRFPEYADCNAMIKREFEIAELFRTGFREPAFWVFRWIPWLVDVDRTEEVYVAALKRAPYSPEAAAGHMNLAVYYEFNGMTLQSLDELRKILRNHPKSSQAKYAKLALANGLFELSRRGDGDSRLVNEAVAEFKEFCKAYPGAPETEFARNRIAEARDIQAVRLCEIADFYRRNGRSEASERYLAKVMSDFPDSVGAPEAEKKLTEISDNYLPSGVPPKPEPRMPDIRSYNIPSEAELMLISPLDGKNHYLLPVPDIKGELLHKEEPK